MVGVHSVYVCIGVASEGEGRGCLHPQLSPTHSFAQYTAAQETAEQNEKVGGERGEGEESFIHPPQMHHNNSQHIVNP